MEKRRGQDRQYAGNQTHHGKGVSCFFEKKSLPHFILPEKKTIEQNRPIYLVYT